MTESPPARLPLTYDECRALFRRAAVVAGLREAPHPITAVGPEGQRLTVEVVQLGSITRLSRLPGHRRVSPVG